MLRNIDTVMGASIVAIDGLVGHVKDVYFDEQSWVVRYLVVETGSSFFSRRVLISPLSISAEDRTTNRLNVSIRCDQVRNSHEIDTEKPVSRQHEVRLLDYYEYPIYWGSAGLWGAMDEPNLAMPDFSATPTVIVPQPDGVSLDNLAAPHHGSDPHLRSVEALRSYAVQARDGEIGHIQSLLIEEKTWAIRYAVVSTSKWWLGHDVLIAPQWITNISWSEREISLRLTRQAMQACIAYDPALLPDRSTEIRMHEHYGYAGYWLNGAKTAADDSLLPSPAVGSPARGASAAPGSVVVCGRRG